MAGLARHLLGIEKKPARRLAHAGAGFISGARLARQSRRFPPFRRRDRLASPLCARIRSRPPSHPFRAWAAPCPWPMRMRFAAAAPAGNHRSPAVQDSDAQTPFRIPPPDAVLRQRPTRRARFRFHKPMAAMPQDAWRTLKRRADRPRSLRRSHSAIRAARRGRIRPEQTSPQPHASRPGFDKNLFRLPAVPSLGEKEREKSAIRLFDRRRARVLRQAAQRARLVGRSALRRSARRRRGIDNATARVGRRMSGAPIGALGDRLRWFGAPFLATAENFP